MVIGSNLPNGSQHGPHLELSRNLNVTQKERFDSIEHAFFEMLRGRQGRQIVGCRVRLSYITSRYSSISRR